MSNTLPERLEIEWKKYYRTDSSLDIQMVADDWIDWAKSDKCTVKTIIRRRAKAAAFFADVEAVRGQMSRQLVAQALATAIALFGGRLRKQAVNRIVNLTGGADEARKA